MLEEIPVEPGGFYTGEIREGGVRTGFEIRALTPGLPRDKGILARKGMKSPYRVGGYGVNLRDMEEVGARALEEARKHCPLIVIDEIGNMELISSRFQKAVESCLDSPTPVLGVIKAAPGQFTDRIKSRPDVEIFYLARDSYEEVKKRVRNKLTASLGISEKGR